VAAPPPPPPPVPVEAPAWTNTPPPAPAAASKPDEAAAKAASPVAEKKTEKKDAAKKDQWKYVEISPMVGLLVPFQKIGGVYPAFMLKLAYLPPIKGQPVTVGMNFGLYFPFFQVQEAQRKWAMNMTYYSVPIQVEASYAFATGTFVRPYLGAGAGLSVVNMQRNDNVSGVAYNQTGVTYNATVFAGVRFRVGPGDILLEFRGNYGEISFDKVISQLNTGGFIMAAGYAFQL
jgi:hypothetical protein